MITTANLADYLASRGFKESNSCYKKSYPNSTYSIVVDFSKGMIIYPELLVVHDGTTSNFEHPENFVVLDCVDRLMENGYQPDSIELETRWKLGHTAKSGKADICVRDRAGDMYLIVECKTPGSEYDKARSELDSDGGQLFSYWQQENKTRWLCLYTADFDAEQAIYNGCCINVSLPQYQTAGTVRERHQIWKDSYESRTLEATAVFSPQGDPYRIDEQPFTKRNLKALTSADKSIFIRDFEEILRHNSISDKENAFNKLVVLFICKIVDEIEKNDDETLDFQIKYSDTYELVQDRLQLLYKRGMSKFLNEDIYYLGLDYPTRLVSQYHGSSRKELIKDLQDTIRKLKFFTNSDFAFKDVHNDRLFRENGMILFEMVRLIQPYRIIYNSRHQILGDLFEILLNSGFKQDEGQFFTPTPIARFVWDSIPPSLIMANGEPPRMIDFACGSSHFLSEGVSLVNELRKKTDTTWCESKVYGIEKDDRLARVSKVSLLMNGIIGNNITCGDGLREYDDIKDGSFDIVVSNPPYSVAAFKKYLSKSICDRLSLSEKITDSGNQIESLFVERANELLRADGICVLVLPTALFSNTDTTSIATRQFILRHFIINAIVDMGTKTFQDTGTPTSIVFMRKRHQPPEEWKTMRDSVDAVFSRPTEETASHDNWEGPKEFEGFLDQTGIDRDSFAMMMKDEGDWWLNDALTCGLKAPKTIDSSARTRSRFRTQCINALSDAFYYYLLAGSGSIVYVKAPSPTKEQESFLGYRWSSSRSVNGLISLKRDSSLDGYETRAPSGSIAALIRESFLPNFRESASNLPSYSKVLPLAEVIDFVGGNVFDCEERIEVRWNCKTVALGDLCPGFTIGGTPDTRNPRLYEGDVQWASIADLKDAMEHGTAYLGPTKQTIAEEALSTKKALPKDTLLVSFKLTIGACAFTTAKETFTNEAIAALNPTNGLDDKLYIYCLIASGALPMIPRGTKKIGKSYNMKTLANVRIPYPDEQTRNNIVQQSIDDHRRWIGDRQSVAKRILCNLAGKDEAARILLLLESL